MYCDGLLPCARRPGGSLVEINTFLPEKTIFIKVIKIVDSSLAKGPGYNAQRDA